MTDSIRCGFRHQEEAPAVSMKWDKRSISPLGKKVIIYLSEIKEHSCKSLGKKKHNSCSRQPAESLWLQTNPQVGQDVRETIHLIQPFLLVIRCRHVWYRLDEETNTQWESEWLFKKKKGGNYRRWADSSSLPTLSQPLITLAFSPSRGRHIHSCISHCTRKRKNITEPLLRHNVLRCSPAECTNIICIFLAD